MKNLIRAIVFYTAAIYLTGLIIPGFRIVADLRGLVLSGLILSILFTFVNPFLKFLFLPINVITLGLFSFVSQVLTFYIFLKFLPQYVRIEPWLFAGANYPALGISVSSFWVGDFLTIVISTFVISLIVSVLTAAL